MNKKVKKISISRRRDFCKCLGFEKIIPIVNAYFQSGCTYILVDEPLGRVISFYAEYVREYDCGSCEYKTCGKIINLYTQRNLPDDFYKSYPHPFEKGVVINVNGSFAGKYCPKYQVLSLSNWLENSYTTQAALELVPELLKILEKDNMIKKLDDDNLGRIRVTIGADPEFEEMKYEYRYAVLSTSYTGVDNQIGCDDSEDQIEIHPDPADTPEKLVENIRNLITQIDVPISVAGDVFPLGGHIHFGFDPKIAIESMYDLLEVLDDFIGVPLDTTNGMARDSCRIFSSFKLQPYGFEYRTPPSSYLCHPTIAYIIFKAAHRIVEKLVNGSEINYQLEKRKIKEFTIYMPTKESYIDVANLTEDEYSILIEFLETYHMMKYKPINKNWKENAELPQLSL